MLVCGWGIEMIKVQKLDRFLYRLNWRLVFSLNLYLSPGCVDTVYLKGTYVYWIKIYRYTTSIFLMEPHQGYGKVWFMALLEGKWSYTWNNVSINSFFSCRWQQITTQAFLYYHLTLHRGKLYLCKPAPATLEQTVEAHFYYYNVFNHYLVDFPICTEVRRTFLVI